MIHLHRPRLRAFAVVLLALAAAAAFAAVGGATTDATAPSNTTPPAVSGSATAGSTLTTTSGSWSGTTPITFAYRWQRCDSSGNNCTTISGASEQTYVVQQADAGSTLRSQITATNSGGSAQATSNHTGVVTGATAPTNTALPSISGSTTVGSTLTAAKGSWTGTSPISYQFQWKRCDTSGANCTSISGADQQTYQLANGDSGHAMRVVVTATNAGGQAQATSGATGTVTAGKPAVTAAPAITGSTAEGATLTVSNGTWGGTTPITYTYAWSRCDANGANCAAISGATKSTYTVTSSDVGHKIGAAVTATNTAGNATAQATPVGPITSTLPPGAVKLADGEISVPAASIPDTDRLTIISVSYSPRSIHGRAPVTASFKVIDQNKYVVSGALVYVIGLPYSWMGKVPEVQTNQSGVATATIMPTIKAPKRGALVLFVRARTPQGNLLAGSSTRRLVQVSMFP